jgi:hypothetical protein
LGISNFAQEGVTSIASVKTKAAPFRMGTRPQNCMQVLLVCDKLQGETRALELKLDKRGFIFCTVTKTPTHIFSQKTIMFGSPL